MNTETPRARLVLVLIIAQVLLLAAAVIDAETAGSSQHMEIFGRDVWRLVRLGRFNFGMELLVVVAPAIILAGLYLTDWIKGDKS